MIGHEGRGGGVAELHRIEVSTKLEMQANIYRQICPRAHYTTGQSGVAELHHIEVSTRQA